MIKTLNKSEFTCKICNQILKEASHLPCHHMTICGHHLTYQSSASFKCKQCNVKYQLDSECIKLEPDTLLREKLERDEHLSEDEKRVKNDLNSLLNDIERVSDELRQHTFKFEYESHENFAEMRFMIDLSREESIDKEKENFDQRCLDMIEDTRRAEKYFQQILDEKFRSMLDSIEIEVINVDEQRHMLSEIFRQLSVNVPRLEKLVDSYVSARETITSKLNELTKLRAQMKECKYDENKMELNGLDVVRYDFNALSRVCLLSCSGDQTIKMWTLKKDCECVNTFRSHTAIVHKIELFSNKLFFISGSHDKTLKIWNLNGECVQTLTDNDENGIRCLKLLYEGEKQLLLASSYNRIKMYDLAKAECVSVLHSHGSDILCMEQLINQASMNVLASGDQDGRIKLWDLKRMLFIKNLLGHKNDVLCLKALKSNEHEHLASGSKDKTIKIWNTLKGVCLKTFDGHYFAVSGLDLKSKNELVSCSWDKTLKIWSLDTGECLRTFGGHSQAVNCVRNYNDIFMFSASSDCTIKIWNLYTNECVKTLTGHQDTIRDLILF